MPAPRPLDVAIAGASDVGEVREHNEDHLLVGDLDNGQVLDVTDLWTGTGERGPLFIVCDGMGGVDGGEVASELAARSLWREMIDTPATRDPEVFARLLRRAARVANHDVHEMAKREPGLRGMGTTLSAAGIVADRLVVATVGDSRVYVQRADALVQVTRDQSLQSALIAAGHTPYEAAIAGGAILQALGVGDDVEPSLSITEVRKGDRILMCSDGLHGLVGDPALAILLATPHTVIESARLLIEAARAAGGSDNITAVVAEVNGDRLIEPKNDDDLPEFLEFDPQREGDPALTPTSYVARRLAAKIGLPATNLPSTIPVTGQHRVYRAHRLPATALPIPNTEGPARARLNGQKLDWYWYLAIALVGCALAWMLGGR